MEAWPLREIAHALKIMVDDGEFEALKDTKGRIITDSRGNILKARRKNKNDEEEFGKEEGWVLGWLIL
jgi:hypothetical protein